MLDSVISSIEKYRQPTSRVILALSGGVDSTVLLDLLAQYQAQNQSVTCFAIHIHHGLSDNADDWVECCQKWCDEYQLPLVTERVELNLSGQVSLEQEARNKRYQALAKHINKNDLLLTGQHCDDQLETFLLALKRGSGPKGLSAMPKITEFSDGWLLRPLLNVYRADIVNYAQQKKLQWIEDESNQDTKFDRNFLRNDIIPKLKKRWPTIAKSVLRSSQLCADQEALISELLIERLTQYTDNDGGLCIAQLQTQSELARNQLLRLWLAKQNCIMPSLVQLQLIWQQAALAKDDANPTINITSGQVRRFRNRLYCVQKSSDVTWWSSALFIDKKIRLPDSLGQICLTRKSSAGTLSLREPKQHEQVRVHFNPTGLVAHPSDRGHSRKLKKLFQEYNVPSWLRTRTPIIMYENEVAMLVNLFVCKDFHGDDCEIQWDKV
ncbi:tRNA lysidine(34) synthetase TilS [Vibrio sp. MA40-2]|uniref:tRNA lysidine(34) synthetase TilS n=1 Tax=Vibrio sp. MA40-2 TaxID=3391828 RepID=UPI0039A67A52